jgi:hypothetical protein
MSANREREIAALEQVQFGAVSISQLEAIGLSQDTLYRRVEKGLHNRGRRAIVLNPGVHPGFEQHVVAAVLAGGPGAYASHDAAAQLSKLPLPMAATIEITTVLERRVRLRGVRCHRSALIVDEQDICVVREIRVSTPERTIVDLSGRYDLKVLGRMIDDALRRGLTTIARLSEVTERLPPAPGRSQKKMRTLLARRDDTVAERESFLEDFVFEALRRFGLPVPEAQFKVVVDGKERRIDLCYGEHWLALEAIGFDPRRQRAKFDDEALRGNELQLAGFKVLEFTSAFTDWQIASHVARALGVPKPCRPRSPLTFLDWCHRRNRLGS